MESTNADSQEIGVADSPDNRAELLAEREFTERRIADLGGRSLHIVQNMVLIIGTGVLAALEYKGAFAISPVLWGAWMLYAQQTDRETRRFVAYSRWIEGQLARLETQGPPPVRFRSAPAEQRSRIDDLLYLVPGVIAFVIHVALIGFGFTFLRQDSLDALAVIFLVGMLLVTVLIILVALSGDDASNRYAAAFAASEPSESTAERGGPS